MNKYKQIHNVIFAKPPRRPELITLKTVRHPREAEVVITDRLVSEEI
jgi:siroheme synthase